MKSTECSSPQGYEPAKQDQREGAQEGTECQGQNQIKVAKYIN